MALAFFCRPRRDLGTVIPFHRDQTPRGYSRDVWWVEKGPSLISTPSGVYRSTTVRSVSLRAQLSSSPACSGGSVKGRLVFVIVTPSVVSAIGGVELMLLTSMARVSCSVSLLMVCSSRIWVHCS